MGAIRARIRRGLSRLFRDPLEPILPRLFGYPRVTHGVPGGQRLYVIGDIHGRADLLDGLHDQIERDAATATDLDHSIIYLGDLIDGGPDSRQVLDLVLGPAPVGIRKIALMGNHERMMLDFLERPETGQRWLDIYGRACLTSYGVDAPPGTLRPDQLAAASSELHASLPDEHLRFLQSLPLSHSLGDYLFVHAGIRPGVPLSRQDPNDLIWIRHEFLRSRAAHEKVIVHGHSFTRVPRVRAHRIGLDTGAFFTGRLTCLILQGTTWRFL